MVEWPKCNIQVTFFPQCSGEEHAGKNPVGHHSQAGKSVVFSIYLKQKRGNGNEFSLSVATPCLALTCRVSDKLDTKKKINPQNKNGGKEQREKISSIRKESWGDMASRMPFTGEKCWLTQAWIPHLPKMVNLLKIRRFAVISSSLLILCCYMVYEIQDWKSRS